jgi:hypothetical protein
MSSWQKTLLAAAAVCAVTSVPALAAGKAYDRGSGGGGYHHGGGGGGGNKGAPGPIAGAGLPFLLLAGGYALMRRYRGQAQ